MTAVNRSKSLLGLPLSSLHAYSNDEIVLYVFLFPLAVIMACLATLAWPVIMVVCIVACGAWACGVVLTKFLYETVGFFGETAYRACLWVPWCVRGQRSADSTNTDADKDLGSDKSPPPSACVNANDV